MHRIFVYGTPAPQGSKNAYAVRGKDGNPTGKINQVESSKKVKPWRAAVAAVATNYRGIIPTGPVTVGAEFLIGRPKSHYGTGRNARTLKDSAPRDHTAKPDLDKLIRSTLDALKTAGIYGDDSAVNQFGSMSKRWAEVDEIPGAIIEFGVTSASRTPD